MPHSLVNHSGADTSVVAISPRVVNFERGDPAEKRGVSGSSKVRRFTPHFRLLAFLHDLRSSAGELLSDRARRVLVHLLWRAGRRGEGDGCKPDEAMLWRGAGGISADAQLASVTVDRAVRELRAEKLLRWRVVYRNEWLPGQRFRAREVTRVFFVAVDEIAVRLGLRVVPHDAMARESHETITSEGGYPITPSAEVIEKPRESAGSDRDPPTVIHPVNCINELPPQNTAHAAPVEMVGDAPVSEPEIGNLVARWRDTLAPSAPPSAVHAVRSAMRRARSLGATPGEIEDAIDAAAHPTIGRWVREKRCTGPGLFVNRQGAISGCFVRLASEWAERRSGIERAKRVALVPPPPSTRDAREVVRVPTLSEVEVSAALASGDFLRARAACAYALGQPEGTDASGAPVDGSTGR